MREGGPYYYDIDGTPIADTLTWGRLMEQRREDGSFRIGDDTLPNGVWISTVWLGLDHRWGAGPPLIFESMAFGLPHREMVFEREMDVRDELDIARYSTLAQAQAGHAAMLAKWATYDALETAYKRQESRH